MIPKNNWGVTSRKGKYKQYTIMSTDTENPAALDENEVDAVASLFVSHEDKH